MELLEQYLALTTDVERQEFLAGLDSDQLTELREAALEAFADAEAGDLTDEVIARMGALADTIDAVRAQETAAETEAQRLRDEAAALAERIRGEQAEGDGDGADGEGEGDGGDGDAGDGEGGEGDGADGVGDGADGEGGEGDGAGDGAAPQAVAAAAAGAPAARPSLARANARRPQSQAPRRQELRQGAMVAATDVPGIPAGQRLRDERALAEAFAARLESLYADSIMASSGPAQKVLVASVLGGFPAERMLGRDAVRNAELVMPVITAAAAGDEQALVAAGGLCAPLTVRYDLPTLGDDARPIRDSLPRFGADRGGVRWMPSPDFSAVDGALDVWTMTDDVNAVDNPAVRKPCLRVDCPDEVTTVVQAITECLLIGNVLGRTFPELIQAWMRLLGVATARKAENELITGINAGSTAVTTGQLLGATRDVLAAIDRANAYYRWRYRLSDATRLRWMAPRWLRDVIRTDLAREMPGSTDERLATADAKIAEFFAVRNILVTWHMDGVVAPFGTQGAGPLQGYPTTVQTQLFIDGTWVLLDGGRLDLGAFRDGDLVAANDYKTFAEFWEYPAKFGPGQSMRLTLDVCPDGATSGTVDIDPCTTGS